MIFLLQTLPNILFRISLPLTIKLFISKITGFNSLYFRSLKQLGLLMVLFSLLKLNKSTKFYTMHKWLTLNLIQLPSLPHLHELDIGYWVNKVCEYMQNPQFHQLMQTRGLIPNYCKSTIGYYIFLGSNQRNKKVVPRSSTKIKYNCVTFAATKIS